MTPIIGGLLEAGMKVLDKVIPDPRAKAAAQLELIKLQQAGEFKQLEASMQLALAQIEVNKLDAQSGDAFRGGWRPAAGWVCVSGLAYQFLLRPLLPWLVQVAGGEVPPLPVLDLEELMFILAGLLGLGGFRTLERIKGKV